MAARLYYLVDEGRMQILLVSGNREVQKLSGFFFILKKFSLLSHKYFTNRKSYRTILFIEN